MLKILFIAGSYRGKFLDELLKLAGQKTAHGATFSKAHARPNRLLCRAAVYLLRMKNVFVVLLLLVVALAIGAPCCAWDACCTDAEQPNTAAQKKPDGTCSPFFACAACPSFAQVSKPFQLVQASVPRLQHTPAYNTGFYEAYVPFFWKPPRSC